MEGDGQFHQDGDSCPLLRQAVVACEEKKWAPRTSSSSGARPQHIPGRDCLGTPAAPVANGVRPPLHTVVCGGHTQGHRRRGLDDLDDAVPAPLRAPQDEVAGREVQKEGTPGSHPPGNERLLPETGSPCYRARALGGQVTALRATEALP